MTLTFTDGTITTTASEQNLFDVTADAYYATHIFLHNMTATETFVIKVYVKDQNAATMRVHSTITRSGVQSDPAGFIAPMATKQYRVSIQRTAGTDRAVTWQRIDQTG